MKKILVLAFAFVVAAGAFAQTPALTFGMYGDITATAATADSFGVYSETYLAYKAKDMGFAATIIGGDKTTVSVMKKGATSFLTTLATNFTDITTQSAFDIFAAPRNYSFWYTWCNGLKISAGRLRETGNARLTSYIKGLGFSTRMANVADGVMLYSYGIKNLTIAWFTPINGVAVVKDLQASSLGVSYAIPGVATVVAAYRSALPYAKNEASLGVDLKAIKDVTLKFGYKNSEGYWGLSTFFGPKNYLYATFGQVIGSLNLGVDANFMITPNPAKYGIMGMAEYTMGSYVLGAKVSADNGDDWFGNGALFINPYLKRNFAAGDIKVGVTYNAGTAKIEMPVEFEISF